MVLVVRVIVLLYLDEEGYYQGGNMTAEELTLNDLQEAIDCLDSQEVNSTMLYIDGINVQEMPEEVKTRIKWAFDHIYISDNLMGVEDADL